jgi:hypothetical protein
MKTTQTIWRVLSAATTPTAARVGRPSDRPGVDVVESGRSGEDAEQQTSGDDHHRQGQPPLHPPRRREDEQHDRDDQENQDGAERGSRRFVEPEDVLFDEPDKPPWGVS